MSDTNNNFNFPIPNEVLEPFIRQAVSHSIVSAMGEGTGLVETAVQLALEKQVDARNGHPPKYRNDPTISAVEYLATDAIQNVAKETVVKMAEEIRPQIEKAVTSQLKKQTGNLAKMLVDGAVDSLKTSWNIKVDFSPKEDSY